MKILLTGGSGFVGRHLSASLGDNHEVWMLGRSPEYFGEKYLQHDFRAEIPTWALRRLDGVQCIIHCGAEVHGVRSIQDPERFIRTNAGGTFNLLQAARQLQPERFIYLSTADVLGPTPIGQSFAEDATLNPSTPYAAAKGTGEMLCRAWYQGYQVPALVVRFMNAFGESQGLGKFIPDTVAKMLKGETITVHEGGSRHYIHISDLVVGLHHCLLNGQAGQTYHIVGPEKKNQEIVGSIGHALGMPWHQHTELPGAGHAIRYSICDTRLQGVYETSGTMEKLRQTVQWYKGNRWAVGC